MEYLILIIPVIAALFLAWKFSKETVWWEYTLLLVPSILIVFLLKFSFEKYETSSTEYLSYYYVKIRHTDAWNEWIHKTCTKSVPNGVDSKGHTKYRTVTYDCSYCQEHPERWILIDNKGGETYSNKFEFNRIKNKWKTPMVFVDMKRNFHTKDGDAQDYYWNNKEITAETYSVPHLYDNKIRASHSVFNFKHISSNEAKDLGLHDYPPIIHNQQNPIIGMKDVSNRAILKLRYINAIYGKDKQFRTFLLVYYNKSASISELQKAYWHGGNKNELVMCVGVDSLTNEVKWAKGFSWCDDVKMQTELASYLINQTKFDPLKYGEWIQHNIDLWKRKEFKDFEYLEVELSSTQYLWIFIIILMYNVGISFFIVLNNFKNNMK